MFTPCVLICVVCSPGRLHRIERHYISWASLMSWTQRTPSRAASETRVFMETPAFTLASQQRIQTASTSVSTLNLQLTSCIEPWRTKMVQCIKTFIVFCTFSLFPFTFLHPALQGKCWCIASWAWVDRPLWSWPTWCCGSVSLWEMPWGTSSRNEPFILTSISCLSSSSWMTSWHSNGGCVLFSDFITLSNSHLKTSLSLSMWYTPL